MSSASSMACERTCISAAMGITRVFFDAGNIEIAAAIWSSARRFLSRAVDRHV
jgi:hypothetical protein